MVMLQTQVGQRHKHCPVSSLSAPPACTAELNNQLDQAIMRSQIDLFDCFSAVAAVQHSTRQKDLVVYWLLTELSKQASPIGGCTQQI